MLIVLMLVYSKMSHLHVSISQSVVRPRPPVAGRHATVLDLHAVCMNDYRTRRHSHGGIKWHPVLWDWLPLDNLNHLIDRTQYNGGDNTSRSCKLIANIYRRT